MNRNVDRRRFLGSTLAAGTGLILSSSGFAQNQKDQSDELSIGIIGAGAKGQNLIDICLKMSKDSPVRFRAICDIWESLNLKRVCSLLKRVGHEANGYVDYRELLDKEKGLDAVIVATPDFCHAQQTIDCLSAGLDVYCEAPMSNTVEDARRMVKAAKKTGKLLQIGHQRRSNPRYIHCYENLLHSAKILGRITAINGQWNRPARPDIGWSRRKVMDQETLAKYGYKTMHQYKNWMWYKGLGSGPVGFYGSGQLDVFNWFLDAVPKTVTARGGTYYYDKKKHEWFDTVMAVFEYETEKGTVSAFYQTIMSNGYGGSFEAFLGNEGTLEISESAARGGIYRDPQAGDWETWVRLGFVSKPGEAEQEAPESEGVIEVAQTKPPTVYELPVKMSDPYHKPHLQNFFDAVRGQAKLNCGAETAYKTTVSILKVNEAIQAGKTLEFKTNEFEV